MNEISGSLAVASVMIGFLHTALGPDHYLPFIAMSRAGRWSMRKTLAITVACGIGHVLSSALLGTIGIALGIGVDLLKSVESARGDWAAYLMIAFGLIYFIWGLRQAIRNRPHTHVHAHADGTVHHHPHVHAIEHLHVHESAGRQATPSAVATDRASSDEPIAPSLTPWILFTVFLFGPCEALIPMVMFPAAEGSTAGVVAVTALFGVTTITTMTLIVAAACFGIQAIRWPAAERYGHLMAGGVVLACGLAIRLGL